MSALLRLMHYVAIDSLRLCISSPEQLEFWDLTENGGSQWKVEDMPGDCGHDFCIDGVSKYFVTSFEWVLTTVCAVFDLIHFSRPMDAHVKYRSPQNICGAPHHIRVAAFNWRRGLNNLKEIQKHKEMAPYSSSRANQASKTPRSKDDPPPPFF